MLRQSVIAVLILATAAIVVVFTPSGQVLSQQVQEVFVTNFPKLQAVRGKVSIDGPVRLATMQVFRDITVPPVEPTDTTRLVDAGVLVTDGFPSVVLSLHGVVKGSVQKAGAIGAILVPDDELIQQAFDEQGLVHFAMETVAGNVNAKTPYFASKQPSYQVGFARYRVWLYNTTDKTVNANLFAYLTN